VCAAGEGRGLCACGLWKTSPCCSHASSHTSTHKYKHTHVADINTHATHTHAEDEASSLPLLPILLDTGPMSVFDTNEEQEMDAGGVLAAIMSNLQLYKDCNRELLPDELHRVREREGGGEI